MKIKYMYDKTFERIRQSNAWICKQKQDLVTHIAFMSYETPIMHITITNHTDWLSAFVLVNAHAFEYSSTTSKQITQFLNQLQCFENYGYVIPNSYTLRRAIKQYCETTHTKYELDNCTIQVISAEGLTNVFGNTPNKVY